MAISYANPGQDKRLTQIVVLDANGNPTTTLGLTLAGQKRSPDLEILREFIEEHEPDVIGLGADSLGAVRGLYADLHDILEALHRRKPNLNTQVTFVDTDVAVIYSVLPFPSLWNKIGADRFYKLEFEIWQKRVS
jgi:hypothetical protein